jgi:hypothetical protein
MLRQLRSGLTFANVVSLIALFTALGGTSYAALTISGKNVKNGSLTGRDIKNSSLGSRDVKDRRLLAKDFKAGQLPQGAQGPAGPQGPAGLQGPAGPQGSPGIGGLETVTARSFSNSESSKIADAHCPGGKRLTGTAGLIVMDDPGFSPNQVQEVSVETAPIAGTFVRARGIETQATGRAWRVVAYAFCATVAD